MTFLVVYGVFIFLGLFLGFSFKGIIILVIGGIVSSIAEFVFKNSQVANVISYICAAVTVNSKKFDVKHKVFIEYYPAEIAWSPIDADGYMLINCFWVAGSYKGKGFGKQLLSECIKDSKSKNGVVVISSDKKRPFLADKKFFLKNGFDICDYAPPYFELFVKKNKPNAKLPVFKKAAKDNICEDKKGMTVYYSNQCPFSDYYVNSELKGIAEDYNISLKIIHIDTKENAHAIPSAFGIHNVFYKGKFLTHELLTKKRFDKIWKDIKNL